MLIAIVDSNGYYRHMFWQMDKSGQLIKADTNLAPDRMACGVLLPPFQHMRLKADTNLAPRSRMRSL